jgi:hypothetical protein
VTAQLPEAVTESELLHQASLSPNWLDQFVTESNRIDPQPENRIVYEAHIEAVLYAIRTASEGHYALPKHTHELLLRDHPLAGKLRTAEKTIGINPILPAIDVPFYLWKWNKAVQTTIDALRQNMKVNAHDCVWDLHCEFENIQPYELYNGKVGRILMVNHALLLNLDPWCVPFEAREAYFDMIRNHTSSDWGINPPETYGEDFNS